MASTHPEAVRARTRYENNREKEKARKEKWFAIPGNRELHNERIRLSKLNRSTPVKIPVLIEKSPPTRKRGLRPPLTEEQKKKHREYNLARYHANRESILARRKQWYPLNKEKVLAKRKIQYWKDPEKERAAKRALRQENPEKVRAYAREYNKEVKRYARRRKNLGDRKCAVCGIRMISKFVKIRTVKYCDSCLGNKKVQLKIKALYLRRWRHKKLGLSEVPIEFPDPEE